MPFDEKLQRLLEGITDPTAKAAITTLFATTPELASMYTDLAKGANGVPQLTKIEFNPDANDGRGFFDTNLIHIGMGRVSDTPGTINLDKLADVMGHEGQHGIFGPTRLAALTGLETVIDSIERSSGVHDYTDVLNATQTVNLLNEGMADIQGWNSAVARTMGEKAALGFSGQALLLSDNEIRGLQEVVWVRMS